MDGALDDEVWKHACFVEDFEQKQPVFGASPTHPISVAVAIANDTLYVAARMAADRREDIDDALTQRDDTSQGERFVVSLDAARTRRIAYSFAVTARGVRADWIHPDDDESTRDGSWNPVWTAKAKILSDSWTAEMAIPLSQLRLPRDPASNWRINFNWYIPRRNEDVFWRAVPRDRTAWASWFGELIDIPPLDPGLALEFQPYAATKLTVNEALNGALARRIDAALQVGFDAKLRPMPGLTLSATVNPDFGQVEADPAFVNLTAYEVTLQELRPFFVENNSVLLNAGGNYFYSRRIGGLPRHLPSYDDIHLPTQVRILGALAAGGYVGRNTQIATLAAVTDEATADAVVGGMKELLVVSPLTVWAAARVEQQVGPSVVGATATTVVRKLANTGLESLLPASAVAGGGDAKLRSSDGTLELYTYAGITGVEGTAAAITNIETSSAHLFQRPDASHVRVNAGAHHMVGWHAGALASKRAGVYQGSAFVNAEAPTYEINDLGMLMSADDIDASIDVLRIETAPSRRIFQWSTGLGAATSWNFGGMRKPVDLHVNGELTTAGFSTAGVNVHIFTPGGSDDLTRGGPGMKVGWASATTLTASTPRGRAFQLSGKVELDASPTLQQGVLASSSVSARIASPLRLDITPSVAVTETHRQYIGTVTDAGGGGDTYGARYLFGHLSRKDAALELRATWSLSPELVLTVFTQPFVSVGRYLEIGELAAAGSDRVRAYATTVHDGSTRLISDGGGMFAIPEPDYSIASLQSTAVLRWEFAPGSTLFAVWQQSRGGGTATFAQPLHTAAPDAFTQPAVHTFAIKLSYWSG